MRFSRARRKDFDIPTTIKPDDFDWEQSQPLKPLIVRRGAHDPAGYWYLESIELSRTDVTNALCTTEQPRGALEYAPSEAGATSRSWPAPKRNAIGHDPRTHGPQTPGAGAPARPRGARPKKFTQARDAMRDELQQGRRTVAGLRNMLEKNLAETYGVSRDTARKARKAVLSEFCENEFSTNSDKRQIAT